TFGLDGVDRLVRRAASSTERQIVQSCARQKVMRGSQQVTTKRAAGRVGAFEDTMLQKMEKERLRQIRALVGWVAATTDEGVDGSPIRLAQLRECSCRLFAAPPGRDNKAPARGSEQSIGHHRARARDTSLSQHHRAFTSTIHGSRLRACGQQMILKAIVHLTPRLVLVPREAF